MPTCDYCGGALALEATRGPGDDFYRCEDCGRAVHEDDLR